MLVKSNLAGLWKCKKSLIGAFQLLADPIASEHFAHAGYDVVCVDLQHGLLSEQHAFACVRTLSAFSESCVPIIRVPTNDASSIQRALDGGALGGFHQ
jgi:4-hydroxy-2-oxoheptanedioate aldolase